MFQAKKSEKGVMNIPSDTVQIYVRGMRVQQDKEHAIQVSQSFLNRDQHELQDTGNPSSLTHRFFTLKGQYQNRIVPPHALVHYILEEDLASRSSCFTAG